MADFVQKLFFGAGLDVSSLFDDAGRIETRLKGMGKFAGDTFQKQIARELARSISPENFKKEANSARLAIQKFGDDAKKIFEQTLGTNQAKRIFDPIRSESNTFFDKLKSGFTSTLGVGKLALGVGLGNILADVVRGLGAAAAEAVSLAARFELAIAKVQTIADRGFNVEKIGDQLKELSTRIPESATSLAEGLFGIIGSGIRDTADALDVLETSAKAAVAGVSSTGAAAKSIVFVLNAYSKSAEEAAHVSDLLFKTVDEGVIEFNDLAANIGDVVGPAALANASIEDVTAGIATMTKAGISAAESTTALRRLIGEIVSPSEKASKAAKQLGIDLSQAGIQAAGGFGQFIKQITEATKGDITKLRQIFPEERAFRAISILAGTLGDEFQRLVGQFNDLSQVAGATDRAFKIINDTAEYQYKLFKNNLSVAMIDLGNGILNVLKPALQGINDLFDDTRPIDKTIARMKELGVAANIVSLVELRDNAEKAKNEIDNLGQSLQQMIVQFERAQTVTGPGGPGGTAVSTITDYDAGVRNITKRLKDQLSTTEDLAKIEKIRLQINENLKSVEILIADAQQSHDAEANNREAALVRTRNNLLGQLTALDALVKKQKELNEKTDEEESIRRRLALTLEFSRATSAEIDKRLKAATEDIAKTEKAIAVAIKEKNISQEESLRKQLVAQRDVVKQAAVFGHVLTSAGAAQDDMTSLTDEEKNNREKINRLIEDADKKLELLSARSPVEKSLIEIRQRFDDLREQAKGNLILLEKFAKLEQAEIEKAIEPIKKIDLRSILKPFTEKIRAESELAIKLIPTIDFKLPRTTEQIAKEIQQIDKGLAGLALFGRSSAEALARDADKINDDIAKVQKKREELQADAIVGIFDVLDKLNIGAQQFVRSLQTLATSIASGNIIGAITGGIGLLADLFGKSNIDIRREQRALTDAREEETRLLEIARERTDRYNDALQRISDTIHRGTVAELESQLAELNAKIAEMEAITDPRRIPKELEDLKKLRDELLKTLSDFGKFGDDFTSQLALFNLQLDLFNIEEPQKKLQLFLDLLRDKFGAKLPESLDEFITQALDALAKAGKEPGILADFLKAFGLEELTAETLQDLLRMLDSLRSGANDISTAVSDIFGDLIGSLNLEFDLLNVDDPIKKLERLRIELLKKFNSIIPETKSGLDDLINQGFAALQSGGNALKDFLTKFGLEELIGSTEAATRQQLEDLLRTLRSFANDLSGSLDDVGKQAEDLTISQVKSITYAQGNKFIDEITTIRIVVTQMLDQMRNSALATPNFGNLATALTGLNNFAPQNNYYFINNGTLQRISENQLSDIDRRLIQQSRAASQAKGIS